MRNPGSQPIAQPDGRFRRGPRETAAERATGAQRRKRRGLANGGLRAIDNGHGDAVPNMRGKA